MTDQTESRPLFGLVLAGGQRSPGGTDKALLDHGGQSQLAFAVHLLDEHVDEVFVSTTAELQDEPERRKFELIVDRYANMGPVAGILTAMDDYPEADWLVVACDLPNIDASIILSLLQHRVCEKPFVAYASSQDGLPEPLCALYLQGSEERLRNLVEAGVYGPRKILMRSDTLLLELPLPDGLDRLDTADDARVGMPEPAQ